MSVFAIKRLVISALEILLNWRKRFFFVSLSFFLLFISCGNTNQPTNQENNRRKDYNFSIHGANALYPLAQIWSDSYKKIYPGVRITVFPASSEKGKTDVVLGLADIGLYSRQNINPEDTDLVFIKVAKDAVLPTISTNHPDLDILRSHGITPAMLHDIFVTGKITRWEQLTGKATGKAINLYTRSDASGAGNIFAEFLGVTVESLKGTGVYGDPGMTQAIRADVFALGYDNLRYVFDNETGLNYPGITVLPLDFNADGLISGPELLYDNLDTLINSIIRGDYPYPLARDLHVVVRKKIDNPQVLAFLEWIVDEGQELVGPAGYVRIDPDELRQEAEKLKEIILTERKR